MASKATSKTGSPHTNGNALHVPVLPEECVNLLGPTLTAEAPVMIDVTLGMGGHSSAFLGRSTSLMVVGIDRDPETIKLAGGRLARFGKRFVTVRATYDDVPDVVTEHGRAGQANAVLMGPGVFSLQPDDKDCGFSHFDDGPLDTQMDKTGGPMATDVLASADKAELTRILHEYGEERLVSRIAARILAARTAEPIERTSQLTDIAHDAIPAPTGRTRGSPCKRTFQALRIAANDEFALFRHAIPCAIEVIAVGGRIVVESYQSLEDRITKREMAKGATSSMSVGLPVKLSDHVSYLRPPTRGVVRADAAELRVNPRSVSVRLRAVERLREAPYTA